MKIQIDIDTLGLRQLEALGTVLGLGMPGETYDETSDRLWLARDEAGSRIYGRMHTRWWEALCEARTVVATIALDPMDTGVNPGDRGGLYLESGQIHIIQPSGKIKNTQIWTTRDQIEQAIIEQWGQGYDLEWADDRQKGSL